MAITLSTLLVRIDANVDGMLRGITAAERAAVKLGDRLDSIGKKLTLGVTLPIAALGVVTVSAAAEMDRLTRGLTAMTGSAEATTAQLARLEEVAKLPGLGFKEAIQGSIRLQSVRIDARLAERTIAAFGNAIATAGGRGQDLDGVTLALQQIAGKGKVAAEEINQIAERAPQIRQALVEAFGTADTERIQKLNLSATAFITAIVEQLEKLPRVTGGVSNSFENLSDAAFRARAAIGNQLLPAIVPLVEGLANMLQNLRGVNPETVRWAIAIASVAAVAGPLIITLGAVTKAVAALSAAIGMAGLAGTIATGGVLLVLGALAAAFVKIKLDSLAAATAADAFRTSLITLTATQLGQKLQEIEKQLGGVRAMLVGVEEDANLAAAALTRVGQAKIGAPPPNRELRELQERAAELSRQRDEVRRALFVQAFSHDPDTGPKTPPIVFPAGADKLAGTLEEVNAQLFEFGFLARVGVATVEQLPDGFRDSLARVVDLKGRVDALTDNLQKLGSRAPAEGFLLLNALRGELAIATKGVDEAASRWQTALRDGLRLPENLGAQLTVRVPAPVIETPSTGSLFGGDLAPALSRTEIALALLTESIHTVRSAVGSLGNQVMDFGGSQLRNATSGLAAMAARLTPAGLAAELLARVVDALRPAIEALLVPVSIVAQVIAASLVPVLKLLFPIIKIVGIVFTYLQEGVLRVTAAIIGGFGFLLRALGKFINAITPFSNPGNPLVRAGEAMGRTASGFLDAAREAQRARDELRDLSWEDALSRGTDAMDQLTASVLNAAQGFKVERFRFAAIDALGGPASPILAPPAPRTSAAAAVAAGVAGAVSFAGATFQFVINTTGDGEETYRNWYNVVQAKARAFPAMRSFAASLAPPG